MAKQTKQPWRVVYGESRPAWEQLFPTKREADAFAARCRRRGDEVFSVKRGPRGVMAMKRQSPDQLWELAHHACSEPEDDPPFRQYRAKQAS